MLDLYSTLEINQMKTSLLNVKTLTLTALVTCAGFALAQAPASVPASTTTSPQPPATADAPAQTNQATTVDKRGNYPRRGFRGPVSLADHKAMAEKRFARMDANGDGTISKEEFMALSEKRFKSMDLNQDGVITPDERRAMRKHFMRKGGKHGWGQRSWCQSGKCAEGPRKGMKHWRHGGCWRQGGQGPAAYGYGPYAMPPAMGNWQAPMMPGYSYDPRNAPMYGPVPSQMPAPAVNP